MKFLLAIALLVSLHAHAADPLVDFEQLIKKSSTVMDGRSTVYFAPAIKKWSRRFESVRNVKYDVRKTDSLVSPFVGEVHFLAITLRTKLFELKSEAETAIEHDPSAPPLMQDVKLRYAWRTDRWEFTGGQQIRWFPKKGETDMKRTIDISLEDLAKPDAPLAVWLPK